MTVVIGGVVHQNVHRTDLLEKLLHPRQIAQIDMMEIGCDGRVLETRDQIPAFLFKDIQENRLRALAGKTRHQAGADAGRAAGDHDPLSLQTGING